MFSVYQIVHLTLFQVQQVSNFASKSSRLTGSTEWAVSLLRLSLLSGRDLRFSINKKLKVWLKNHSTSLSDKLAVLLFLGLTTSSCFDGTKKQNRWHSRQDASFETWFRVKRSGCQKIMTPQMFIQVLACHDPWCNCCCVVCRHTWCLGYIKYPLPFCLFYQKQSEDVSTQQQTSCGGQISLITWWEWGGLTDKKMAEDSMPK